MVNKNHVVTTCNNQRTVKLVIVTEQLELLWKQIAGNGAVEDLLTGNLMPHSALNNRLILGGWAKY